MSSDPQHLVLLELPVALCLSQHPLDHWHSIFKHVKLLPQVVCTCYHIAWKALSSTFQMDSSVSFESQILLLHRSLLWVPYLTWVHLLFSLSLLTLWHLTQFVIMSLVIDSIYFSVALTWISALEVLELLSVLFVISQST